MVKKSWWWGTLLFLFFLISCSSRQQTEGTMIWIDSPRDQSEILAGQVVDIKGHAASRSEIEKIELKVNGVAYAVIEEAPRENNLAAFNVPWQESIVGDYILEMTAFGVDGSISDPDFVVLTIVETNQDAIPEISDDFPAVTEEIPESTSTPTSSLMPGTLTFTPTATATHKPPASPTPGATQTATPTPTQTPDEIAPPVPQWVQPQGDEACAGQVLLQWHAVEDPSGLSTYILEIQRSFDGSTWQAFVLETLDSNQTQFELVSVCGTWYRARVSARDGAGNQGEFTEWLAFAVLID